MAIPPTAVLHIATPSVHRMIDAFITTSSSTAPLVVDAEANVLVAGTAVFGEGGEVAPAIDRLRASLKQPGTQPPQVA